MNYLKTSYTDNEVNSLSILALAYIGDAVFEMCTRIHVFEMGNYHSLDMHHITVSLVNAKAQSAAAERLLNELTDKEIEYYKRGRNAKVNSVPKGASQREYHNATGLEALFGYLYLTGQQDRISELYSKII